MSCRNWFLVAIVVLVSLLFDSRASAHCDGLDGPVVAAAREALRTGNIDLVLVWVRKQDESEVRTVFAHVRAVRKLGAEAQALADHYFFETLVRLHRAGEGEPYTGLKPAGRDLGPAIPAAEQALRTGDIEPLVKLLSTEVTSGTRQRFEQTRRTARYRAGDVDAGRAHVAAYVTFLQLVENIHAAATAGTTSHDPERGEAEHHGAAHP